MGDSIMPSIIRATTTSGLQIAPDNSGSLQLQTNGTTAAVTIDTSQNVGIGTTSPTYKFQVSNTNGDTQVGVYDLSSSSSAARLDIRTSGTGASQWFIQTGNTASGLNGALRFYDQSVTTERMRIDSSGNVQIGKTSNSTLSAGINLGSLPNFIASTASPSDGPYMQISNIAASVANGFRYISFRVGSSGNEAGSISTNGSSTVSYVTSSDYRLKENVKPMVGALDVISKLNPVTYTWKIDGSDGQGFIAHELQEVVPDAVTGKKDAVDEEGNIKPQGVDTSFLVATLTAAIQEQQTIINDLKARIEALEAKLG
jgi:hypothetical protein